MRELSGVMEMLYILIGVVVTGMYSSVKTYQTVLLIELILKEKWIQLPALPLTDV